MQCVYEYYAIKRRKGQCEFDIENFNNTLFGVCVCVTLMCIVNFIIFAIAADGESGGET